MTFHPNKWENKKGHAVLWRVWGQKRTERRRIAFIEKGGWGYWYANVNADITRHLTRKSARAFVEENIKEESPTLTLVK